MIRKGNLKAKIIGLLVREKRPLSVEYIAKKLHVSWNSVYKAIADIIILELQNRYPTILFDMPIVPLKSASGLLIAPKSIFHANPPRKKSYENETSEQTPGGNNLG